MAERYEVEKMKAYVAAIENYEEALRCASTLAVGGSLDAAVEKFEQAYNLFFDVLGNYDYSLKRKAKLARAGSPPRPHRLADQYSKALVSGHRYEELVEFAARYFRDFGEPSNNIEHALKARSDRVLGTRRFAVIE